MEQDRELAMLEAIAMLPHKQGKAVFLRSIESLPYDIIGNILGCSEATARSHFSKGRIRLGKILSDMGKLKSTVGLEIFTITAIVEFIAIVVASVMVQVNGSDQFPVLTNFVWLFAKMIIFFAVAGLLAVYAVRD